MKPSKNRFFCKNCGKIKMLFETKKKADTFIKFNSLDIEKETANKPERSYFCTYCGGWHTTSKQEFLSIKSRTEKVLNLYEQEKERDKERKILNAEIRKNLHMKYKLITQNIAIIENLKDNDDSKKAIEMLNFAFEEFEKTKNIGINFKGRKKKERDIITKLKTLKCEFEQNMNK